MAELVVNYLHERHPEKLLGDNDEDLEDSKVYREPLESHKVKLLDETV